MKKLLKHLSVATLLISLSLNIMGCNKFNELGSKEDKSTKPTTLKLAFWGNEQRNNLTLKVVKLFEQKHPGVKIETKNYPNTQAMKIDLAMNTADEALPDIIQMNYDNIHDYATRNLLEPFDPYIKQKVLNTTDIDTNYLKNGMEDNQIYGITLAVNAYCMAVDPSAFQKAGVDIPKPGYTYEELYQVCKTLKANIKEEDFYPLGSFVDFNTFVRSTGSTYYNSNGTSLGYENDQVFIDFIKLRKKFLDEGLLAPSTITNGRTDKDSLIVMGKAAFNFGVSNNVSSWSKYAKRTLQIIPVPCSTTGKITSYIRPSMFFSVSSYSKHKKEAVEFVDFFINDIEANNILLGERGVPVSSKVSESVMKKLSEPDKQQYSFINYLKDHPSPADPSTPGSVGSVNSLFNRLSEQVLNNKITPEEGSKLFRSGANKILSGVKGE
jgi:multiple sugar transport system substrate-binding protein